MRIRAQQCWVSTTISCCRDREKHANTIHPANMNILAPECICFHTRANHPDKTKSFVLIISEAQHQIVFI